MAVIREPKIPKIIDKLFYLIEKRIGGTMEPVRLLLWTPKAFVSSLVLEGLIAHKRGKVSSRLLKLIRMQVSLLIACPFCIDMNSSKFRDYDITIEEIKGMQKLIPLSSIKSFSQEEKLTLYFIRGLIKTPIDQNPKVVAKMTQLFTEKEFGTIVTTIAQVDYWTRVIQGFGIVPVGFLETCDFQIINNAR